MNRTTGLRYYVYVSKSKVDMLYPQIPAKLLKKVDKRIEINLKVINISLGERNVDETTYSRLTAVVEYLKATGMIGTISQPGEYFYGKVHLQWTEIYPNVVFYGGILNDIAIGLGGSMKHVLGYESVGVEPGISHTPWLVELLSQEVESIYYPNNQELSTEEKEKRILSSTRYWADKLSHRAFERFEFIARTLKTGTYYDHKIVIGSPLFIATVS